MGSDRIVAASTWTWLQPCISGVKCISRDPAT
jgi:hypothetical protein